MFDFKKKRRSDKIRILLGAILLFPVVVFFLIVAPFGIDFAGAKFGDKWGGWLFIGYIFPLFLLCGWPADRYTKERNDQFSFKRLVFVIGIIYFLQFATDSFVELFPKTIVWLILAFFVGLPFLGLVVVYFRSVAFWQEVDRLEGLNDDPF